jgi:hypothetical protein
MASGALAGLAGNSDFILFYIIFYIITCNNQKNKVEV